MKVLFVLDPSAILTEPYVGGTEAFSVALGTALSKKGHTVDIIAGSTSEASPFQLIEISESPYSMRDDIHSEFQGQAIYKELQFGLMNLQEYDIVHFHSFNPRIYEYGSAHNVPSVVTLHLPWNEKLGLALSLYHKRSNPTFVAVSQRLKDSWTDCLKNTDIVTIHNGIDHSTWQHVADGSKEFLLWSGRINADKNPLDAIRLAHITQKKLVLAGPIDNQEYFDEHILPELKDDIEYVGHLSQKELRAYAAKASCFIATALWDEPFGLSAVEMLASGIPVVGYGSAIPPDLRDLTGVLFTETTTPEALAELVKESEVFDADQCNESSQRFSMKHCADMYEQLYKTTTLNKGTQ